MEGILRIEWFSAVRVEIHISEPFVVEMMVQVLGIFYDSCASAAGEASDEGILSVPSASTAWRTKPADFSLS